MPEPEIESKLLLKVVIVVHGEVKIIVPDASKSTEVIILAEYDSHLGLKLVYDQEGRLHIPERIGNNLWVSNFKLKEPPMAIYAISTLRGEYKGWGKK